MPVVTGASRATITFPLPSFPPRLPVFIVLFRLVWIYFPFPMCSHMTGFPPGHMDLSRIRDISRHISKTKISYRKREVILHSERLGGFCCMQVCILQVPLVQFEVGQVLQRYR